MCIRGTYAGPITRITARATPEMMVDDSDSGIEYSGNWVHNPSGTSNDDFGGSVTFTDTPGSTATSNDIAVTPSLQASQFQTSVHPSSPTSPTSTSTRARTTKFPAGAIAGLAVACLLVLIVVGLAGYRWRRRKQARTGDGPTPSQRISLIDPDLRVRASEPSEKRNLATTPFLSSTQPALAYPQSMVVIRAPTSSSERRPLHENRTNDLHATKMDHDRRTGFEPLGSPSSAAPLIPEEQTGSSITPDAESDRYPRPRQERRRSVDGGVRLAGGLLGQGDPTSFDDRRSSISTLPPAYEEHQAT